MKDGVGRGTWCRNETPDSSGVGQVFGKCPAWLPETMTFSPKPSIFTLCPAARSGNSGAKGRRYAVGSMCGAVAGVVY
jgi:hypothetical protein